jgi:PAS domain S-box-containing protein
MHSREGIQESYLWKFVNYTWDAIGILDANGHMRFWNDGSVRLFHFLPGDVVGRHIKDFMVPKDLHEEIDLALGEIKATKQAKRNMRTARLTAEGKRIPVDITISPIVDKGQFQGYFGIMRAALPTSICDLKRFRNFGDASGSPVVGPYVFVALPFSTSVVPEEVWSLAIEGAADANDIKAYRVDQGVKPVRLAEDIFNSILNADLVIADLTGANPNVFYELGLAHALDKTVIQLVGDEGKIPFDVAGIRTIKYDLAHLGELKRNLTVALREALAAEKRASDVADSGNYPNSRQVAAPQASSR